jgi:methanogenic corrinoid protein MtbC1
LTSTGIGTAPHGVTEDYLDALLAPDARRAWAVVQAAVDHGVAPRRIYLDVLAPAMVEIGARWQAAQLSVAREHLATQITQTVLARLAPALGEPALARRTGLAVVAGTPGELHAIGPRMVADFLEGAGWEVLALGPDTPAADVIALVAERGPDVVALSTALPAHLLAAGDLMAALGRLEPRPYIVAGGHAYEGDERRALVAGADAFAADPEALLAVLSERR